jgi:hypothetical protein
MSSITSVAFLEPPGFIMVDYRRGTLFVSLGAHIVFGTIVSASAAATPEGPSIPRTSRTDAALRSPSDRLLLLPVGKDGERHSPAFTTMPARPTETAPS